MRFDPSIAAVRFGTGLSPVIPSPQSVDEMMELLRGPDVAAVDWPILPFAQTRPTVTEYRNANRALRDAFETPRAEAAEAAMAALRAEAVEVKQANFSATLARHVSARDGLRERLVAFWANHFTVRSKNGFTGQLVTPYVEDAIRPHVAGRFADMLRAVITHPMMIGYLDQSLSAGPNSRAAERRERGLNENLARELLELHTVGVNGPYDQEDVRQLAELLTGLFWDMDAGGTIYRPDFAEPGAETVLGRTYSEAADIATVHAVLDDLARHPATARHLATKIAAHFVADDPPADLVAALETRFLGTDGDLAAVTETLLSHPSAWVPEAAKVRPPYDFIAAGLRALGVGGREVAALEVRQSRQFVQVPLGVMGQMWESPPGPDGWPDTAPAWITPQFMAARIDWSMRMPQQFLPDLPDPRDLAAVALPQVPDAVAFAASAAEDRRIGVGVVLASAAFQRR